MRLRCLVGVHEMTEYDRVEPPQAWQHQPPPDWIEFENEWGRPVKAPQWRGFPVFVLKECRHCGHTDYDMEFPDEQRG